VRTAQLLDCAEGLFIEQGFDGVSIEDVCRAAGVSRPVVYEHFGSKSGVYLACIRRIRDEFDAALVASARDAPDLRTALRLAATAFFTTVEQQPQRWSLVYGSSTGMVGAMADDLSLLRAGTVGRIAELITAHRPDADVRRAEVVANMISGAGEQLGRWWLRHPGVTREQVVRDFTDFASAAARES
jgi:AcrR family transcriptional regulator